MRKIVSSAIFALVAMLTGCGTTKVFDGVEVRGCKDKSITVVNTAERLSVSKGVVEVCRGNSVVLKFRNNVPENKAHTKEGSGNQAPAPWLNVNNADPEQLKITVDADAPPTPSGGAGYKYTLEIEGLGLLDPRFVVQ